MMAKTLADMVVNLAPRTSNIGLLRAQKSSLKSPVANSNA
jgi:hypothetical protein